jgi:acyl-CoA thioester hydrolase
MAPPYRHDVRIRYGEVDVQGHVFNSHYLAYVDDALEQWLRSLFGGEDYTGQLDLVVKKAELTWSSGARNGEVLAIDIATTRIGRSSIEMRFAGSVGERPIFEAVMTYVSITPGTVTPTPVPDHVRALLS